jgi:CheY-like chemotaxis protein
VEVDQVQIEQVLLNLYVNAWQAMPEGGELHVKTANLELDDNSMRKKKSSQCRHIKVTVTDTGIGMDETTLQKIFDPFFTTKEVGKGTGLGLASAYGIIKNHGGSIEVRSEIKQGATVTIFLPATDKKVVEHKTIPDQIVPGLETILFIDDEKLIRDVGRQMLTMLGYRVVLADSGEEACRIYQNSSQPIDLVILDLIMPKCGGGKTFDRIRQINPQAKVLLSSGYSVDGEATAILQRGCKGFIQKPFNLKQLSRKIREVLEN